jgi:hypothetical protein
MSDNRTAEALTSILRHARNELCQKQWDATAKFASGFAGLTHTRISSVFRGRQTYQITPDMVDTAVAVMLETFTRADLAEQADGITPILGTLHRLCIRSLTPDDTRRQTLLAIHALARRYPLQAGRAQSYLKKLKHYFDNRANRSGCEPIPPDIIALLTTRAGKGAGKYTILPLSPKVG